MSVIDDLMADLDERRIAQEVGLRHDEHRMGYRLTRNTVADFPEFDDLLGKYYREHFLHCCCENGTLMRIEAHGRAKEIIEQEYRKHGGNIVTAFHDVHDATNNGARRLLDLLADHAKAQATERYIRDALDRHIQPHDWSQKIELIRQLIARFGSVLGTAIDPSSPERYAQDYRDLIRGLASSMRQTSSVARRL